MYCCNIEVWTDWTPDISGSSVYICAAFSSRLFLQTMVTKSDKSESVPVKSCAQIKLSWHFPSRRNFTGYSETLLITLYPTLPYPGHHRVPRTKCVQRSPMAGAAVCVFSHPEVNLKLESLSTTNLAPDLRALASLLNLSTAFANPEGICCNFIMYWYVSHRKTVPRQRPSIQLILLLVWIK